MGLKFLKVKRTVVQCRRQTETVVHQCHFPGTVPCIHPPYLGQGNMGLIYDDQIIILEEVHQAMGRFALLGARQMPGIVFNAGAEAGFPKHFHIKIGTLGDTLCL